MRVLSVHSGNLYGGVERLLATVVANRAAAPEVRFSFALSFDGRIARELRAAGAEVAIVGAARIRSPLSVRRARARLKKLLREQRYDVAICHNAWSQVMFGRTARAEGIVNGCWVHDVPDGKHWLQRLARRAPPDFAIANSDFTGAHVRLLFGDLPVFIVRPPVAPPETLTAAERLALRAQLGIAPEQIMVLQISRMEPLKGQAVLVDALAQIARDQRWHAVIVGGAQRPKEARFAAALRAAVKRHRLQQRITFLGERSDAGRLLNAADIFVQPNTRPEAFGQVFAEAMYVGVPVVTSAIGGPLEIFETGCGALVPPGNVGALAAALQDVIENDAQRARYRRDGPGRAMELCFPPQQVQRLAAVLSIAAGGKARLAAARHM